LPDLATWIAILIWGMIVSMMPAMEIANRNQQLFPA